MAPLLLAGQAAANPEGAQVVAGQVSVASAGATTTVAQTTNRAIVNWQGFSIGAGETTRFVQPGAASAILNRVTGGDPSRLMGQLTSNGRVYLINPHGVVVGPEGRINTAAFLASTLDVPDAQFLAGGPLTFQGTSGAGIKVLGTVEASDGDVVLVAANIETRGRVAAPNGQAILGAGGSLLYMPDSGGDIVIQAPAPGALVDAGGTIEAASVQLKAAGSAYSLAVNAGGTISATAVHDVGGRVVIDGGEGDVGVAGAITARHGEDGGEVRVLAGGATRFNGTISARGGEAGGDGGFVEVSGKTVDFLGRVDVAAPHGRGGRLLIDPVTASIDNTNVAGYVATLNGGGSVTIDATASLTVDAAVVSSNNLALLKLDAPNITINADIDLPNADLQFFNSEFFNSAASGTLTLAANATINSRIFMPGHFDTVDLQGVVKGSLTVDSGFSPTSFTATNAGNEIGAFSAVQVTTFSGDLAITSSTAMSVDGEFDVPGDLALRTTNGDLTFASGAVLTVGGTATLAGGGAFINNAGTGLFPGAGRVVIYSSPTGFNAGGLAYPTFNAVNFPDDPQAGNVIYFAGAASQPEPPPVLIITADSFSKMYGQANPTFTAGFSGGSASDLTSPVQFQVLGGGLGVGTYTIQPFGAASTTHSLQYVNGILTVTPAPLVVTANDASRLYGAANPALSVRFLGLVNGDQADNVVRGIGLSVAANPFADVGTYAIAISPGVQLSNNYIVTYVGGVLSVTPAPLTIRVNSASRVYGGANPAFTATYTGLVNDETPAVVSGLSFVTPATSASDVGAYSVALMGGTAANYTITRIDGQLTVTPAPLTITANSFQVTTGAPLPPFSATYAGFVNGDGPRIIDLTLSADPGATAQRGTYAITPSGRIIGSANYALTFVNGVLTVVPPPPIVYSAIFTTSTIVNTTKPKTEEPTVIVTGLENGVQPPDLTQFKKDIEDARKAAQVTICADYCFTFGHGAARTEFNLVINDFAAQLSLGLDPPVTGDEIRRLLTDPDRASAVMGLLMPFVFTHLDTILRKTGSLTAEETAFAQQVADYMTAQRRAAADVALAEYQAWAYTQYQERQERINSLKAGDLNTAAQSFQAGIESAQPPVPPAELIDRVKVGFSFNAEQIATMGDITAAVASLSDGSEVLSTGEIGVFIGDASQILRGTSTLAGTVIDSGKVVKAAPAMSKILTNTAKTTDRTARSALFLLKEAEYSLREAKAANDLTKIAKEEAEIARLNKVLEDVGKPLRTTEVVGDVVKTGSEVAKTTELVGDVTKTAGTAAKGLGVVAAIPVVGEVVAVVGDWIQVGIAVNEYRRIGDFNHDFQAAYDDAQKPVTIADLKAKIGTDGGQNELFGYLTAMAATGGKPPDMPQPTMTVTQVSQLSLSL